MTVLLSVLAALLLIAAGGGLLLLRRAGRTRVTYGGVTAVEAQLGAGRVEIGDRRTAGVTVETVPAGGRLGRRPRTRLSDGVLRIDGRQCDARLLLRVPAAVPVRAEVRDGAVTLWGAGCDLALVVGRGGIVARDLTGERVVARTGTGEIALHFAREPRDVAAQVVHGPVTLLLPGGPYEVELEGEDPTAPTEVDVACDPAAGRRVRARSGDGEVRVLSSATHPPVPL